MKVINANEGQKINYSVVAETWLNIGDRLMLNLEMMEADNPVHEDIMSDNFGRLRTGEGDYYVAQIDIPARTYIESEVQNPDYSPETEGISPTTLKRDPVPFSMDNVTLTLFALKEGVF